MQRNSIKWTGSKSPLAKEILSYFPKEIDTYYEPFCGSCSVMFELLKSNIKVNNIVCSDVNEDLINLWKHIKSNPKELIKGYYNLYYDFNSMKYNDNIIDNRNFIYYKVRDRFNLKDKYDICSINNAIDFLFILRTCYSGMIRYSKKGNFNSPCHFSRPGIEPHKLEKIILETSKTLRENNIQFISSNYENIVPKQRDFMFLDPPYSKCDKKVLYYGSINEDTLINYLNSLECGYCLTYNGNRGKEEGELIEPNNTIRVELEPKNSSFSRIKGKKVSVREIMYVKK